MNGATPLQLRVLGHGPRPKALFFSTWQKACAHICDHLLTPPEAFQWAFLLGERADLLLLWNEKARFRFAKAMWKDQGHCAQAVYDEYQGASQRGVQHAILRKSTWQQGDDVVCVDSNCLRVVIGLWAVRSAYLVGAGTARRVLAVRESERGLTAEELADKRRKEPFPRLDDEPSTTGRPPRGVPYGTGMRPRRNRRPKRTHIHGETAAALEFYRGRRNAVMDVRLEALSAYRVAGETNASLRAVVEDAIEPFDDWKKSLKNPGGHEGNT